MFQATAITEDAGRVKQGPWALLRNFSKIKAVTGFKLGGRLTVLLSVLALSACATGTRSHSTGVQRTVYPYSSYYNRSYHPGYSGSFTFGHGYAPLHGSSFFGGYRNGVGHNGGYRSYGPWNSIGHGRGH